MKSISQKLQDDIRTIMEGNIKHSNQQAIDVHEPEKDEITAHDFKKLRAMKKTPDGKIHNCATHVEHAVLGKGTTVSEEHAEPDANGNIEWYTVQFENSVQKVLTKDLTITMSEAHMHESEEEQVNEEADQSVANVAGHKVTLHRSLSEPGTSDTYTLHHPSGDKKVKISFNKHGDGDEVHGEKVNKAFGLDSNHKLGHKIAGSMNGMGGISKFEESYSHQVDEEEKKKIVSPFDYKNYKSQIPTKPGETAGFDSKKISTGTVYSRKPVKEAMSHQAATTMKHIPNPSPALKKAAKDIKPGIAGYRDRIAMLRAGGVKEEAQIDELSKSTLGSYLTKKTDEYMKGKTQPGSKEHAKDVQNMGKAYDKLKKEEAELDEAYQTAKSEFVARQGRLTAAAAETEKDPARLKRMSNIPGYSAAMDLAKKTTQGAKHTKEEVEQMDELSTSTLKSYISGAQKDRASQTDSKNSGDREEANYAKKQIVKRTSGIVDAKSRLNKEEVEQEEYTFADYLDAVRTQYGDEDAVLIANEAFKNKDITLFNYQSQSPEA